MVDGTVVLATVVTTVVVSSVVEASVRGRICKCMQDMGMFHVLKYFQNYLPPIRFLSDFVVPMIASLSLDNYARYALTSGSKYVQRYGQLIFK